MAHVHPRLADHARPVQAPGDVEMWRAVRHPSLSRLSCSPSYLGFPSGVGGGDGGRVSQVPHGLGTSNFDLDYLSGGPSGTFRRAIEAYRGHWSGRLSVLKSRLGQLPVGCPHVPPVAVRHCRAVKRLKLKHFAAWRISFAKIKAKFILSES